MSPAVVVVTGAAQGLGKSIATAFAHDGAAVVVADLNAELAEQTAATLREGGARAVSQRADVSDEHDVTALADIAELEFGPLTAWLNNAGVSKPAMLHKMDVADFDLVLRVHARGTFLGIREAARRMIASGTAGTIVNVTSSAGLQGTIGQINYAAGKGAITSMTKSAAKELARYGIRVNALAPLAETPMTQTLRADEKLNTRFLAQIPLGRFATADEIAGSFVFLASPAAAYMTGQVVCVDGGLYMAS